MYIVLGHKLTKFPGTGSSGVFSLNREGGVFILRNTLERNNLYHWIVTVSDRSCLVGCPLSLLYMKKEASADSEILCFLTWCNEQCKNGSYKHHLKSWSWIIRFLFPISVKVYHALGISFLLLLLWRHVSPAISHGGCLINEVLNRHILTSCLWIGFLRFVSFQIHIISVGCPIWLLLIHFCYISVPTASSALTLLLSVSCSLIGNSLSSSILQREAAQSSENSLHF